MPGEAESLEQTRQEQRRSLIKPLLDECIPDAPQAHQPLSYFQELVAQQTHKPIDTFNDDDQAYVRYLFRTRNSEKEKLLAQLTDSAIVESELPEFIRLVADVGRQAAVTGTTINFHLSENLIYTTESLAEAQLYQESLAKWRDNFVTGNLDPKDIKTRWLEFADLMRDLSGVHITPRPPKREAEEKRAIFDSFITLFTRFYSLSGGHNNPVASRLLWAERAALDQHDPTQIDKILQIFTQIESATSDLDKQKQILDIVNHYAWRHGLTRANIWGMNHKLLPAMLAQDEQVNILNKGGNVWGMNSEDWGAADFVCQSYITPITPNGLNELLLHLQAVPTTDAARLDQNRLDAPVISGSLRELVHDQRPYVHNLLLAALHFYETGNTERLELVFNQARRYEKDGSYHDQLNNLETNFLNRDFYESLITETVQGVKRLVKVADVLRRLVENTKAVGDKPPVTSDNVLNQHIRALTMDEEESVMRQDLSRTLHYVNTTLLAMMNRHEVGIEPNWLKALSWLDQNIFAILRNLSYEEQQGAYRQDWFATVLLFEELINSPHAFDESEFHDWLTEVQAAASMREAYQLVSRRILSHVDQLTRLYRQRGEKGLDTLWSSNSVHGLTTLGLPELNLARTAFGRKTVRETIQRRTEPGYHPGD